MESNWIPVREELPDTDEWVQAQTQDGTVYPAHFKDNKWIPLFRGGLVEHLMHGKVVYWLPHTIGYPYVQCKCGKMFLQAEGRKECPICATFNIAEPEPKPEKKPRKAKPESKPAEEEIPFTDANIKSDDDEYVF